MTRQRKTSEFLRTCIFEALMLLLDQKKYEDITISELAEKAGVSRMTYYRTYENKEDVVIQFLRTRTDSLLRQTKATTTTAMNGTGIYSRRFSNRRTLPTRS